MPDLIQPGTDEHSTHRSVPSLRDQTNHQPDESMECWRGKARPEHGKETGQRARCGGAGRHRRITLTRMVAEPSMLSSSHSKIHEPPVPGVSPTDRRPAAAKLRNTRAPVGARNSAHLMQPADTRGSAHRAGRVVERCESRWWCGGGVVVGERPGRGTGVAGGRCNGARTGEARPRHAAG
jgi:hypothetical protein